ncbi:hypothetical protein C7212DRAFT_223725 [Tuber magnatum]|uniref:Uncharacterized protein n=1 Tax=Tuber magnatum TaxID=42249 RepID=A0A317SI67_9PEZI|nr:hypothetical protein C7212DRAFT_223725 [Tuber magnatum]
MLPPFEIRGLRWPAEDPESGTPKGYLCDAWPEIRLETHEEYDNLIREHPGTVLSYLDEEDGDVITVGSAEELYARVEDVFPTQGSAIFDLLLDRTHPNYKAALDIWQKQYVDVSHAKAKAKGKALAGLSELEPSTARSGLLVDISDNNDTSHFSHNETSSDAYTPQSPLLTAFSNELERIMQEAARPGEDSSLCAPSPPPSPPNPPVPSIHQPANRNGEMLAQSLREIVRDIGRVALEFRSDVPSQARPTIGAFNNALSIALGAFTSQLQSVALDAANAAKNAAQATRDMDTSEIEAHGRRVRELAETIGHMAVQGAGAAREEVGKALGSGFAEGLGDLVEVDAQSSARAAEQSTAGSYRATVETDDEEEGDTTRMDKKSEQKARAKSVWELSDNLEGAGIIPVMEEVPPPNDVDRIPSPSPPLSMLHGPVSPGELDDQPRSSAPLMPTFEPPAEGTPSYFPHAVYPTQPEDIDLFHPPRFEYNHQHPPHHARPHSSRFPSHIPPDYFSQGARMPASPPPPPPPPRIPHSPAPMSPPSPPLPRHQIPPYPRRHHLTHWGSTGRGWDMEEARSRRSGISPPEWPLRREDSDISMRGDVGSHEEEYTPNSEGPRDRRVGREDRNRDPRPVPRSIRRSSTLRDGARRGGQARDSWAIPQPLNRVPSFGYPGRSNSIASLPPTPAHPRLRQFPSQANFRSPIPSRLTRDLGHRASVPNFRSEDLDTLVNPFLTPPRQLSPPRTIPPAPEPPASAVSIPGEWPRTTVVIPPPPPPAPMSAFSESPVASPVAPAVEHRAGPIAPAEPARRQQTRPRELNEHSSPSTNPFLERRRMRENRLGLDARNWGGQSHNRRTIIPPIPDQEENGIDKCVATLIEMGYGDDGGESAIERLKVYAQIVEGNVQSAVEMLEEEREAWERRQ